MPQISATAGFGKGKSFGISGIGATQKILKKYPTLMPFYVLPRLTKKVAITATTQAQRNITAGGNNYTGKMRANLVPRWKYINERLWSAAIGQQTPNIYTRIQEFGSSRPWYPPFSKIFKWGKSKGISSATGKVGRPPNIENLDPGKNALAFKGSKIFGIWQKMGNKGIRAKRFGSKAMIATAKRMQKEKWAQEIWNKGLEAHIRSGFTPN